MPGENWDGVVRQIVKVHPWLLTVAAIFISLAALGLLVWLIIAIISFARSKGEHSAWGVKWGSSLKENFENLNRDSEIKSNVIFLIKIYTHGFAKFLSGSASPTEEQLARQIFSGLSDTLRSYSKHRCAVLIKDEATDSLKIKYGAGYSDDATEKMRLGIQDTCAGKAFRTGETYYCKDTADDKEWRRLPNATHQYRSVLCVPIKAGEKIIGILNIDAVEPDAFRTDEIDYIELFSTQFAILITAYSMLSSRKEVASS